MSQKHLLMCGAASVALIASISIAQAQAPPIFGMALCKNIKSDGDRLKCFNSLTVAPSQEKRNTEPAKMEWSVTESRAPLDDSPQVVGTLRAIEGSAGLFIRCQERKTEAFFYAGDYDYLGAGSGLETTIRINDGQATVTRWSPSSNGKAAFAASAVQFIRALPDQGTVFIRVVGYNGTHHDAKFSLGDVSPIRDRIAAACNWTTQFQSGNVANPTTRPPSASNHVSPTAAQTPGPR